MENKNLSERVSKLGFPLFESDDTYATLADVIISKDLRLWEGFPVMLANAFKEKQIDFEEIKSRLNKAEDKKRLISLIHMSLALFKAMEANVSWAQVFYKSLPFNQKEKISLLTQKISDDIDFSISGYSISSQRLKKNFTNYFNVVPKMMLGDFLNIKDEASLEYSLSQIFTIKQKELILKKLKGEKLTKTEKEYFSRVIKKKLSAVANPDLYRLAQRVLQ